MVVFNTLPCYLMVLFHIILSASGMYSVMRGFVCIYIKAVQICFLFTK